MVKREEIEKQIEFLQKDVVSVRTRLDAVRGEEEQLVSTLSSLQGAIQVSQHYLSICDKSEDSDDAPEDEAKDDGHGQQQQLRLNDGCEFRAGKFHRPKMLGLGAKVIVRKVNKPDVYTLIARGEDGSFSDHRKANLLACRRHQARADVADERCNQEREDQEERQGEFGALFRIEQDDA